MRKVLITTLLFGTLIAFGSPIAGAPALADPIRMPTEAEIQQAREELAEIRARETIAKSGATPVAISAPVPSPTASAPSSSPEPAYGGPSFVIRKTCASPCRIREASGKCLASEGEICGPGYVCAPRCISRDTAGKCMAYSADYCAAGASCTPTCLFYTSGKVCSAYDSDTCSQNIVGTR